MENRAVLLVSLANPHQDLRLNKEYNAIQDTSRLAKAKEIVRLVAPTLDTQATKLFDAFREHSNQVAVFHFAGHGNHNSLTLDDLKADGTHLNEFLTQQPGLQLVFLNGCNTSNQAKNLAEKTPVAIGTTTNISDETACMFADSFYKNLLANHSIQRSFDEAKSEVGIYLSSNDIAYNDRGSRKNKQLKKNKLDSWQLYYKDEDALQWKLSDFIDAQVSEEEMAYALQRMEDISAGFGIYKNTFSQLAGSHIPRKETAELRQWIEAPLNNKEKQPVKVLAGNAGYGKTVIMKDLQEQLQRKDIPVLAIKADQIYFTDIDNIDQKLGLGDNFGKVFRLLVGQHKRVVVLIDQIDALSQSLSSDLSALTVYQHFIEIISKLGQNIRIVVSCRVYDLDYGLLLQKLKVHQAIKVGVLTSRQIFDVLTLLDNKINQQGFPSQLLKLLETPLHLDIFCRIYSEELALDSLVALQDLYNELWRQKIDNIHTKNALTSKEVITLIESLAETMDQKQQISVAASRFKRMHPKELEYLSTEHLLIDEKKVFSFFINRFSTTPLPVGLSIMEKAFRNI